MGSALDPDEILADFTRAGIGQMLQVKQMASPEKIELQMVKVKEYVFKLER